MLEQFKLIMAFMFGLVLASLLWKISLDFVSDKPVPDAIFSSSIIDKKEEVLIENKTSKKTYFNMQQKGFSHIKGY